ncbi:bifunctional DNA primase/polymerase [Mycolicibacterium fortuitum]|uniref:bifunctional DNA primase/polymerase n=1 Tax=Mycolicibacterium fortuitum TaxID=1766 RepID=UPI0007ED8064|nr:bifunctional DNA primase/polymerase [Mycolicibacterium fortuitum]NOQ62528.1 hypothetical protein [Mycolicibacterium fortuitum]OBI78158.1 hypothetical protein A5664_18505 [Mycolicibacterium fortuitum]
MARYQEDWDSKFVGWLVQSGCSLSGRDSVNNELGPYVRSVDQYRQKGWLGTLPLPEGEKHPPPSGWTGRNATFATDDQARAWAGKFAHGNIGLHLGPTPDGKYEVVGIDADDYVKGDKRKHGGRELKELEARHGPLPATYISTSRSLPSGIRFFRVPVGYEFKGKLADGIDVIQRVHRYAVVWPSWNPDSQAYYVWLDKTGIEIFGPPDVNDLPVLSPRDPETAAWFNELTRDGTRDEGVPTDLDIAPGDLMTWAVKTFPGDADSPPCKRMQQVLDEWCARIAEEESTHDKITGAQWNLLCLAGEGHSGWQQALKAVGRAVGQNAVADRGKRGISELRGEVRRGLLGALRKAKGDHDTHLGWVAPSCSCDDAELEQLIEDAFESGGGWHPDTTKSWDVHDEETFWSAREVLTDLRQFARARRVGPWAMLGQVLARVAVSIPPRVVLPPTIGGVGSLNLDVALVGKSGQGKGISAAAAAAWLRTDPDVYTSTLGSGEGMAKVFAYKRKSKEGGGFEQVGLRTSVLFEAPEVDNLAALGGRSGSTLLPQLRSAWSGETLGFSYADPAKALRLCAHRYRLCLVVGVQPGRAASLFEDADGGTPQRFVWLPVLDPEMPDVRPNPAPLRELPAWNSAVGYDEVVKLVDGVEDVSLLDVSVDPDELTALKVPDIAVEMMDAHIVAMNHGELVDPLDGHKFQCRLKVAAALMWLDGRTEAISDDDWNLSGIVMQVSDRTRREVEGHLRTQRAEVNHHRARAEGEREVVKVEKVHEAKIARICGRIRDKLRAADGQSLNQLKKSFGPEKDCVDEALERLSATGDVRREEIVYRGRRGWRFWLEEKR